MHNLSNYLDTISNLENLGSTKIQAINDDMKDEGKGY